MSRVKTISAPVDDTPMILLMDPSTTCIHPDHDVPTLLCGAPLPCPYHTATIDLTKTPATVEIPTTATAARRRVRRLMDVAEALEEAP